MVLAVAISRKADIVVSGAADQTVRVWSLRIGNLLRTLKGHRGWVRAVAISPDGSLICSASEDKTLKIWDLSGNLLCTLEGHKDFVHAVAIIQDDRVISASADKTLKLWDLTNGQLLHTFEGHRGAVNSVAVTQDGTLAVSASLDRSLKIWDLKHGKELNTLHEPNWVHAVAFVPNSNHVLSAGNDGTIRVWDVGIGTLVCSLEGHTSAVYALAITPNGDQVVSGSADHTLRAWDLITGRSIRTMRGHAESIYSVAIAPNGAQAVSASADRKLKAWNLKNDTTKEVHRKEGSIIRITANPGCLHTVLSETLRSVKAWHMETGESLGVIQGENYSSSNGLAVTADGTFIIGAIGGLNQLGVWNLKTGSLSHTFPTDGGGLTVVKTALDDQVVLAASGIALNIWHLKKGILMRRLLSHSGHISEIAISQDGNQVISVSWEDQTVRLWDIRTGESLVTLNNRFAPISFIEPNRNRSRPPVLYRKGVPLPLKGPIVKSSTGLDHAKFRATSDASESTLFYRLGIYSEGKRGLTIEEERPTYAPTVNITPDGNYAIFAFEGSMEIWDLKTHNALHTFIDSPLARELSVSPFGKGKYRSTFYYRLATEVFIPTDSGLLVLKRHNAISVWALETGIKMGDIVTATADVNNVNLSPSGTRAIYAYKNGKVSLYDTILRKKLATFTADASITSCTISPDGHTSIAGDDLGYLHFLRVKNSKESG